MGTLWSELGAHADRIAGQPRLYVDANVPTGLVAFMRARLRWDVLFVLEHNELRRAPDIDHYHLARQLCRTLITFDRDYLDNRKFPPHECGGVIVLIAPNEQGYIRLLTQLDTDVLRTGSEPLPLEGRKLHVHVDWTGGDTIAP